VSAFDPFAYLDVASAALDLPIPLVHREAVAANLARLHAMAREVLDFPLPASSEPDAAVGGEES
jgi:hypothetical protein